MLKCGTMRVWGRGDGAVWLPAELEASKTWPFVSSASVSVETVTSSQKEER